MSLTSRPQPDATPPTLCASCAAIQQNWRRAPGHAELVQTSSRKVERSDGQNGGHTVIITRYVCDACGTRWDYANDKTNQHAGWSLARP